MKTLNIRNAFAAFVTASALLTSGVAPMNSAYAGGGVPILKTPLEPNICLSKPWLCKGGGVILPPPGPTPPTPPAPPAPPAKTGGLTDSQKLGLGILGAVAVGTIIANSNKRPNHSSANAHIAFCQGKYKTYDINTNSFMSNAGYRKPCISPYM